MISSSFHDFGSAGAENFTPAFGEVFPLAIRGSTRNQSFDRDFPVFINKSFCSTEFLKLLREDLTSK
jgi:hypothetical protein